MNAGAVPPEEDRRRTDRRRAFVRLADYTVPEVRKAIITSALLVGILSLFFYMVRDVLVAALVGVVTGIYLLPFHHWAVKRLHSEALAAIVTITLVTVPLVAVLAYSWIEIMDAAEYLQSNRVEVSQQINDAIRRLPYTERVAVQEDIARWVARAAERTRQIVTELQEILDILVISVAVFLFTVFYILTDEKQIVSYVRSKIPGRYRELSARVRDNVEAVAYGALYATFLTQIVKSMVVLMLNLAFEVPLAFVLSIASFFIGFFPIVGSWSIYLPVGIYLMIFDDNMLGGVFVIVVGFLINTVIMSLYLRPKIAAERSQVLNFYWMFIALVTGVYTFGIVGILIGPVLIGVLKAIFETVTGKDRRELVRRPVPS